MRNFRKISLSVFLFFLMQCAVAQSLRIYHIGVGQGDCTLIIGLDKSNETNKDISVSMLIDSGDKMNDDKVNVLYKFIKDTLNKYTGGILNYLVVSHMHSDHVGNMVKILNKIYQDSKMKSALNIIDRFTFAHVYDNPEDECWDYEHSDVVSDYLAETMTHFPNQRMACESVSDLTMNFKNITIMCMTSNGLIAGENFVKPKSSTKPNLPKSENDLSFGFLILFNGFQYFTGGDIGGGSPYSDGETPLANFVAEEFTSPFHVCGLKVSHHGSGHSTNKRFRDVFAPRLGIIPSALKAFKTTKLPVKSTIDYLTGLGCALFYTFIPSGDNYYSGDATAYRDIDMVIPAPPGYNKPITMEIRRINRNKDNMNLVDNTLSDTTVTCTKPHPMPTERQQRFIASMRGSAFYPVQTIVPRLVNEQIRTRKWLARERAKELNKNKYKKSK